MFQQLSYIQKRFLRPHSLAGKQTQKDKNLARQLFTTFERDLELADINGIHFYVQNGTVTLYGTVLSELDRDLLISLVRQMPGVKGVVGHLQIVDRRFQEVQNQSLALA